LILLKNSGWNSDLVEKFNSLMKTIIFEPEEVLGGLKYHFTDIFVFELSEVDPSVSQETLFLFFSLYFEVMSKSNDKILVNRISDNIFEATVNSYVDWMKLKN